MDLELYILVMLSSLVLTMFTLRWVLSASSSLWLSSPSSSSSPAPPIWLSVALWNQRWVISDQKSIHRYQSKISGDNQQKQSPIIARSTFAKICKRCKRFKFNSLTGAAFGVVTALGWDILHRFSWLRRRWECQQEMDSGGSQTNQLIICISHCLFRMI